MSILTVKQLTKQFGGLIANNNIDMDVQKGQLQLLSDRTVQGKQHCLTWSQGCINRRAVIFY